MLILLVLVVVVLKAGNRLGDAVVEQSPPPTTTLLLGVGVVVATGVVALGVPQAGQQLGAFRPQIKRGKETKQNKQNVFGW